MRIFGKWSARRFSLLLLMCLVLLPLVTVTYAQGEDRVLQPDVPTQGAVTEQTPIQIYTFTAGAQQTADITLVSLEGAVLSMVVTDATGQSLAQATTSSGVVDQAVLSVVTPQIGTYYVSVATSPSDSTGGGAFTVTLTLSAADQQPTPVQTPEAQPLDVQPNANVVTPDEFLINQVFLASGIQVDLTWQTNDDLNLQIRDPVGGTLFWDSRTTVDGGTFGPDVNGLCELISTPPNVETASWPGGSLPTGSYEILVYHRQSCETANPVDFTVDVTVDGQALPPINATIAPPVDGVATVYISSFTVNQDGTAAMGVGGPYLDTRELPQSSAEVVALPAAPVTTDAPVEGVITNEQYFQTYSFDGQAGQTVSIEMSALQGSLDTLLLVLNSAGTIVADNDDVQSPIDTNSRIDSLILPASDTYTIYAGRYGKRVAGTEGTYSLVVSTINLPQQVLDLELPRGDIEITLTWNTNADLQLLVRDPFGNAVFDDAPRIQSGGELVETGNINCTISEVPVYYIYWPQGFLRIGSYEVEVWYQNECSDTRPVTFNLFIVVQGQTLYSDTGTIRFNERYLTSFSINQDGTARSSDGGIIGNSDTLPYQDELASAISITSGDVFTGSITADNKFDLYVFEGRVNDVVNIRMNARSQTLDTQLYLIDPRFLEIAANDDASAETTDSVISGVTLTEDGTYVIIATHFGAIYGGTTGAYDLSLDIARQP